MFDSKPVDVTSVSASDVLDGGWGSTYRGPGVVLADHLGDGTRSVVLASTVAPVTPRLSGGEVVAGLEGVDGMRARMETLTLHLVVEALDRGMPSEVGLSAHDWLVLRCPWLAPAAVHDLLTVARGVGDPLHAHLREQVLSSVLPVRRAAAVLRSLGRVKPFLPTAPRESTTDTTEDGAVSEYEAAVEMLTGVAGDAQFTDRELRRVTDHLISTVLPEKDHDTKERTARELRGVNESSLADGSLVRFVVTVDPEGAAVIRSIVHSPLAAPCPGAEGEQDTRSAAQRRHDALVTVLKRGVAGGESVPTSAKASVVVTIAWDLLRQTFTGTGRAATGEVLSPQTVRKVACDADLIPMVLGSGREILDQGRTRRLVTPGQRRALHHRDKGCTFPGCTTPAPWCDAHHVVHWSRGGTSDLSNYALLCGRHHTCVHERDLSATVHPTGVTWHL